LHQTIAGVLMSSLKTVDSIIHARWLIPVEPNDVIYENHALVMQQGKILDILPSAECEQTYQSDDVCQLNTHALIPGLINAHTHAAMNLLKGYADDYQLMHWLEKYIWPAEQKWVSEEFVYDGSSLAFAEMIQSGTTCFADMYFYPEIAAKVAKEIGLRACIGLIVIDFPSAWASSAEEYLDKGLALHDQINEWPLISSMFAPHSTYTVSDAALKKIATLSNELNIPIQTHLHETKLEVEDCLKLHKLRPLQRLENLGLVSSSLIAVHMTEINKDDIKTLANNGVHVVHCPESNLKLASGLCPVAQLQDSNVNVCIGTDGAASNNDLSMIGEMRTTALIGKIVAQSAEALTARTVLEMATINGAKALAIDKLTGSLKIGKAADVVAINLDELANIPVYEPISQLIYTCQNSNVTHVWVNGKILLNNKQLCTINESALKLKAADWQRKISSTIN